MNRKYPDRPIVGVGAVIFSKDAFLLARRAQAPGRGRWSLPGGAVELGETVAEALRRELLEEVSVTMEVGGLVGVYDKIFRDSEGRVRYHYVVVDYWGRLASGCPRAGSDISEIRWVPVGEMESVPMDAALRKAVATAVEMRDRLPRSSG